MTKKELKVREDVRKYFANEINKRLEYLRKQIREECISYSEIVELQSMEKYIDKDDVELLIWVRSEE